MIQDIAPSQLDNSYKKKVPHAGSRMLGFGERTVYLEYNGELQFLTYGQWKDYNENVLGREVPPCVYLFSIGGRILSDGDWSGYENRRVPFL